jgi:hypothetical protein
VSDVAFSIARWVDGQSSTFADTGAAKYPLTEAEGTRLPLRARIGGFSEGSDHQVWSEGSWRIPVIYLADWPDIYIHTNKDVPGNIDATKLKRAIFIAAASGWTLANLRKGDASAVDRAVASEHALREAETIRRAAEAGPAGEGNFYRHLAEHHAGVQRSMGRFGLWEAAHVAEAEAKANRAHVPPPSGEGALVYRRNAKLKGPMNGFGYSWLDDELARKRLARPALLSRAPRWEGGSFGYEALNLVDGKRPVVAIAADLAATVGPAPAEEVAAFLLTLERLGVVERVKS